MKRAKEMVGILKKEAKHEKAFLGYAAKTAITDAKITRGDTQHLDIDSGYGFLVATVTLTSRKAAKSIKEAGIVTMTLHDVGTSWRMTSMTWADR